MTEKRKQFDPEEQVSFILRKETQLRVAPADDRKNKSEGWEQIRHS